MCLLGENFPSASPHQRCVPQCRAVPQPLHSSAAPEAASSRAEKTPKYYVGVHIDQAQSRNPCYFSVNNLNGNPSRSLWMQGVSEPHRSNLVKSVSGLCFQISSGTFTPECSSSNCSFTSTLECFVSLKSWGKKRDNEKIVLWWAVWINITCLFLQSSSFLFSVHGQNEKIWFFFSDRLMKWSGNMHVVFLS